MEVRMHSKQCVPVTIGRLQEELASADRRTIAQEAATRRVQEGATRKSRRGRGVDGDTLRLTFGI